MHLDVYHDLLQPDLLESGRPDLVGLDARHQWHVIEAKGRSNGLDGSVVRKAKEQTLKLRAIRGREPILRVASVAHFSRESLSLRLEDPVGQDVDAVDWDFTENQFLRDYYDPFAALIDQNGRFGTGEFNTNAQSETVNGMEFLVADLPDVDLAIGLDRRIYELLRSADDVSDQSTKFWTLLSPRSARAHRCPADDGWRLKYSLRRPRWRSCSSGPHLV